MSAAKDAQAVNMVFTILPGPDRKRTQSRYSYQLAYRNPAGGAAGCVMLWHVLGGRMPYQIALERNEKGNLRFHCTCADAIYRGENENRFCKHVQGLLEFREVADSGEASVTASA